MNTWTTHLGRIFLRKEAWDSNPTLFSLGCVPLRSLASARARRPLQDGFTLIEILMAMTLVGMITSILATALFITMNTWEDGERQVESVEQLRHLLEYIAEDIRGADPYTFREENQLYSAFFGDKKRINFISTSPPLTAGVQFTGLKEVSYWVDAEKGLMLREAPLLHSEFYDEDYGNTVVVAPQIKKAEFEYLYQEPSRLTGEVEEKWSDGWGPAEELQSVTGIKSSLSFMDEDVRRFSLRRLPMAVRVTLTYEEQSEEGKGQTYKFEPVVIPIQSSKTLFVRSNRP